MAVKYKVKAKGRTYTDKDGKEKTQYLDIGVIMDTKSGGYVLKLETIPIGWDGFAFLSEPEARSGGGRPQQQRQPQRQQQDDFPDDDIPF